MKLSRIKVNAAKRIINIYTYRAMKVAATYKRVGAKAFTWVLDSPAWLSLLYSAPGQLTKLAQGGLTTCQKIRATKTGLLNTKY